MEATLGPHHLQVLLLSLLIGSVLIVAVVVLVARWICKRRKRRPQREVESSSRQSSSPDLSTNENTVVKSLLSTEDTETTYDYADETPPHTNNDADDFALRYDFTNRTEVKHTPLSPESPKVIFLVHAWEATRDDDDILGHLADVMQSLCRGRVSVKVDFRCRAENAKDVKGWAEGVLRTCTQVVVLLSERLVQLCRSYRESKMLEYSSRNAYDDIAPLVLRRLSEGECVGRAVFLHLGFREAQRRFHTLLELYTTPTVSPLGSEVFDSGQAASSPPDLPGGFPIEDPAPSYHSEDSHPPCCQRPRYWSTSHERTVDPAGHRLSERGRHLSAPNGRRCSHLPPPYHFPQHVCITLQTFSASSGVSSYRHALCSSESVDDPPPPYRECVSPPQGETSFTEPLARSKDTQLGGLASHTPQLIALTKDKGLQELLSFITQDQGAIDAAMASEHAHSLQSCLERRFRHPNS